jgi:hypothetical protein
MAFFMQLSAEFFQGFYPGSGCLGFMFLKESSQRIKQAYGAYMLLAFFYV